MQSPRDSPALRLVEVELALFRNLARIRVDPHPRFTLIVGENGQGKTNFLEALHYGLSLRPLRTSRLSELIAHGERESLVRLELDAAGTLENLTIRLSRVERSVSRVVLREERPVDAEAFLLAGAVVTFTPDELQLIRAGPERRRRYLDRAVFNRWPTYLSEVRVYQRLLKSRNNLLRRPRGADVIESFEVQLWAAGARLIARRHAILTELQPLLSEAFRRIGLVDFDLALRYGGLPAAPEPELVRRLAEEGSAQTERDRERGFTSVGPHVDDLSFLLDGRPARAFASQGQIRALVLALKVAEIENLRSRLGHAPVLLLDDVSSELDPTRNASLVSYLRDLPCQVLLTTTDPSALLPALPADRALWTMRGGRINPE